MKAFDKVPHAKLIKKIQSYGIKGNIINWIIGLLARENKEYGLTTYFLTGRRYSVEYHKDPSCFCYLHK